MSLAGFHISIRFHQAELAELDKLVAYERQKGPVMFPGFVANRTSIIKALISRELLRLDDESAKLTESVRKAKADAREFLDNHFGVEETPTQRKSRRQRERRAQNRKQSA